MEVDLFGGIPVSDYERSLAWYQRFLGSPPAFVPAPTEAVWEVAEHRYLYIDVRPDHAGHAMHLLFVDDFDARMKTIADRGFEPADQVTYDNGVRKTTYRDPDGNEISFGGAALSPADGPR
jgi:catechol 2,3-dioxygenase-like lactoylglutathione lyase family enzyme